MPTIRLATTEEYVLLRDLFFHAVHAIPDHVYTGEQRRAWAPQDYDRDAWVASFEGRLCLVAEAEGLRAGFVDADIENAYIDRLYVHPAFQRRGVASVLLEHVLVMAWPDATPRVRVDASHVARPLFERFGFQVETEQTVRRRGVDLINFRMSRPPGSSEKP